MKYLIIFIMLLSAVAVEAKKEKKSLQSMTPAELVKSLKWTVKQDPEQGNVESLNAIIVSGDTLYKHITEMVGAMTFYDVKMIANETTGDTIVAVVDDQGNIRNKYVAFMQYVTVGKIALTLGNDLVSTLSNARGLKDDWKKFVDTKNLGQSLSLSLTLGTAIKQMTKMSKVVTDGLINNFVNQKKKIGAYIKESANVTDLSDPKLRNLPDVNISPDDVLTKTEQEITESLAQIKADEDVTMGGASSDDILKELENL